MAQQEISIQPGDLRAVKHLKEIQGIVGMGTVGRPNGTTPELVFSAHEFERAVKALEAKGFTNVSGKADANATLRRDLMEIRVDVLGAVRVESVGTVPLDALADLLSEKLESPIKFSGLRFPTVARSMSPKAKGCRVEIDHDGRRLLVTGRAHSYGGSIVQVFTA